METDTSFHISRTELHGVGFSPRGVAQFETLQQKVSDNEVATTAGVASTTSLKDASFVTLSPNDELPNEFVLQTVGPASLEVGDGTVSLIINAPGISGGHDVIFAVTGQTSLALPLTGVVATREWFYSEVPGPFASDAGASGGGVAVGECYWKGSDLTTAKLATRMA